MAWAACVAGRRRKPKRISSEPTITQQPPKQLAGSCSLVSSPIASSCWVAAARLSACRRPAAMFTHARSCIALPHCLLKVAEPGCQHLLPGGQSRSHRRGCKDRHNQQHQYDYPDATSIVQRMQKLMMQLHSKSSNILCAPAWICLLLLHSTSCSQGAPSNCKRNAPAVQVSWHISTWQPQGAACASSTHHHAPLGDLHGDGN